MKYNQFTMAAATTSLQRGDQLEIRSFNASSREVKLQLALRQEPSQPHMFKTYMQLRKR
jgi:hypothetical protein